MKPIRLFPIPLPLFLACRLPAWWRKRRVAREVRWLDKLEGQKYGGYPPLVAPLPPPPPRPRAQQNSGRRIIEGG